jgi:NAD-specific glutamate dehydrogenase
MTAASRQGHWEHRAVQILSDDLSRAHRKIVARTLRDGAADERAAEDPAIARFRALLEELRRDEPSTGLAALTVAVRELCALADRPDPPPEPKKRR